MKPLYQARDRIEAQLLKDFLAGYHIVENGLNRSFRFAGIVVPKENKKRTGGEQSGCSNSSTRRTDR